LGQVYALLGKADWSREQLAIYAQLQAEARQLPVLNAAVRAGPTDPERREARAKALEAQGDLTAALAEFETAASLALGPARERAMSGVRECYTRLGWQPYQEGNR
jgi:tetratricopeptide (TPR) repeat protein